MELSEYIRIKRNVDQIIEFELNGQMQNEMRSYIDMLENEIMKGQSKVVDHNFEFQVNEIVDQNDYYIGNVYTRKDLENECNDFFERQNIHFDLESAHPDDYHEQMKKAYNRLIQRKHKRNKRLNN